MSHTKKIWGKQLVLNVFFNKQLFSCSVSIPRPLAWLWLLSYDLYCVEGGINQTDHNHNCSASELIKFKDRALRRIYKRNFQHNVCFCRNNPIQLEYLSPFPIFTWYRYLDEIQYLPIGTGQSFHSFLFPAFRDSFLLVQHLFDFILIILYYPEFYCSNSGRPCF